VNIKNIMNHLSNKNLLLIEQKIKARLGEIAIQKVYYKNFMS